MDYNTLLDLATDLGYELAMSGAETFRVEETVSRVLLAYGVQSEVFAIPNCLTVSIETDIGKPMTRMRRIGFHGNDLDSVERLAGLSRGICSRTPDPDEAKQWLQQVCATKRSYPLWLQLLGHFLGAFGFSITFGGTLMDGICSGICGILVGIINRFMEKFKVNPFFRIIAEAFPMALLAFGFCALSVAQQADMVNIGALMLLVPGLLFTNAMRDIIYGDTNSGTNRIVQVLLIAAAIVLGTAAAWTTASALWGTPGGGNSPDAPLWIGAIACFVGCMGFCIIFNIHSSGTALCALGGTLTWAIYTLSLSLGSGDLMAFFWGTVFAAAYAEILARLRKYPAISYLVIAIFPLIPGAGVYYTMNYAVQGDMDMFITKGMHTAAEAGIMAVAILLVSTTVRLWNIWVARKKSQ